MSEPNDYWSAMERLPIALIIDDPMPCINPLYYFHLQVSKIAEPAHERTIPVSFLEQFIEVVESHGVRGDFSVIPYPAGLGSIAEGLEGFDDAELDQWLGLVRDHLPENFDIHSEILTHTLALDLETKKLRDISEHDWMGEQGEEILTEYFAESMSILKDVDLANHGITQPCYFKGDEDAYAKAILNAEKRVNGRSRTHYFLDVCVSQKRPLPYCRVADGGEFVVSIPSGTGDGFWPANNGSTDVDALADFYLTSDGQGGRLKELADWQGPIIILTHWQSLYGNGSQAGLNGLAELFRRIDQHLDGVEWMKISEISDLTIDAHRGSRT